MKKIILAVFFASSLIFLGCTKERTIDLNSNDSLSITPDQEWAVVKVPYAAFLESSDYSASVRAHARSGDIFLVTGKEFVKKDAESSGGRRSKKSAAEFETWYKFDDGFLPSSLVEIYDTKLKAKSASVKILDRQ